MAHVLNRGSLSRRAVLGGAVALGALGIGRSNARAATSSAPETWRTWLLISPDELRPSAPGNPPQSELDEVIALQSQRSVDSGIKISTWGDGPAVLPWTGIALDLIQVHRPGPVRAARALALLHAALADTVIAVRDAAAAYPRPAPSQADAQIVPLGSGNAAGSSFPSEHAAVASCAAAVLAYLFPKEPTDHLTTLATEAAESRLWAGAAYRSDIVAGQAIGQAVGTRAVDRGMADGSDHAWDGSGRPTADGVWQPTPPEYVQTPLDPLAGTWTPWLLPSGDAYRPAAPPAYGSAAWQAELAGVQEAVARRTSDQETLVKQWAGGGGTVTPAGLWIQIARDLIVRDDLDSPLAARALALTSVAMADGFICCWDAKYAYWTERPITADPTLDVLIPTPPFPSFTSGHATASTSAATILGHLFPADAADLLGKAAEASQTRLWAGIHFPIDCDVGTVGGGMVGRLSILRAQSDGAEAG
ncbi:MAG TPA: phosphatase PAP2 family protein [Thermomicrobiales bacterium]|nr:phosphatase PAP2 family protein [Thermomicrobiales bacterium]